MVGLPNRTGRCTICRRMKAKCNLTRPACSRCRRLGFICEYPVLQQGQVFINRSLTDPFVKAVDVVSNTDRGKLAVNSGPNCAVPSRARHNESLNYSILKSPDPAPVYSTLLLSKFIEIYFPNATLGPATRAGEAHASWIHALPEITVTNSAYKLSLTALCVAQLGIWNHNPVLVKESSQLYVSALGELRKSIGYKRLVAPEATLASTAIFSMYELFSGTSQQHSGWVSHVQGASRLLQVLGPSVHKTAVGRLLFDEVRIITIIEALTRRVSIPGHLERQRYANEEESHDLHSHILDLMAQLPSIMEALDKTAISTNKTAETSVLIRLLERCSSLDDQLLAWHKILKPQVNGQLYCIVPSVADSPADDPVLGRVFPLVYQFPSLRTARFHLIYWSMLILLYRIIQDLQEKLKRAQLSSEHKCPSNDGIALLANNICQTLEYCYHSKNGTLGPLITIFPLWVAESFYMSQSNRGRELAWCSALRNTTAPSSRFDLHVMKLRGDG